VEKTVTIEGDVLAEIAYLIPDGWSALARFAVFYGIRMIYPEPKSDWVTGNDLYRPVPIRWKLPESPCKLTVKGYNEDEVFPHTIYLWLLTQPEEEARPWRVLIDYVKKMKRLLGLR